MPDYSTVVVGTVRELIKVAAGFIPQPKFEDKPLLTDTEAAAVNSDRIKLVRVLLEEVKSDVKCESCRAHVDKSLEEVAYLEKEVPRIERVSALRSNLKSLLEEAQREMSAGSDLGITEPLEPLNEEEHKEHKAVSPVLPKDRIHKLDVEAEKYAREEVLKFQTKAKLAEPTDAAKVKSACVPCAIGHFATSAKLLAEATRFKVDGLESPQVMDDIAESIAEQNALERIDLTPAKIEKLPPWEKEMASDALTKSRELRHKLESVTDMEQVEVIAAETENFYKGLNRNWLSTKATKVKEKKELKAEPANSS